MRPTDVIEACQQAHKRLLSSAARLSESDVRAPSSLPSWSRAEVIVHLSRNADSHVYLFEGAMKGETRHQYPIAGMREADIAVGSSLPVDQLVSELGNSCRALEAAWDDLSEDQWELKEIVTPGPRTMSEIAFRRLREVEVHHVDLDVGYLATDWPSIYVEGEIERSLPNLPERADHVDLVKWLIGRGEAPRLIPW